MIRTGTKVIVLSSSHKKKTGPRRGSIGFISSEKWHGSEINYLSGTDTFVNLTRIMFTRYGFEVKERIESKCFVNILPHLLKSKTKVDTSFLDISTALTGTESSGVRERIAEVHNIKALHSGIVVPISAGSSIIDMSCNDFSAWITSFLLDKVFTSLLSKICNQPTRLKGIIDFGTLDMMLDIFRDSSYRKTKLPDIAADKKARKDVVNLIRTADTIGNVSRYSQKRNKIHKWFMDNRVKNTPGLANMGYFIVEDFYSRELTWKTKDLSLANKSSDAILGIIKNIANIKKKLLCLGQALEEGGDDVKTDISEPTKKSNKEPTKKSKKRTTKETGTDEVAFGQKWNIDHGYFSHNINR